MPKYDSFLEGDVNTDKRSKRSGYVRPTEVRPIEGSIAN